jgi:Mn2+/Fe2+ NRAMP family transporter
VAAARGAYAAAPAGRPVAGLSPGIVAGASDGDPTTVTTLAVVGAQTGFSLAWVVVLLFPMMAAIQATASAVGVASGCGLQEVITRRFGRRVALVSLVSLVAVNLLTLVADLEGGAAAVGLLAGASWRWFVVPLAAAVAIVLCAGDHRTVRRLLSAVVVLLLAYVPAAFLARPAWRTVLIDSVLPSFPPTPAMLTSILTLMGTTLTGYVYFWQTIEERTCHGVRTRRRAQRDAVVGMAAVSVVFWFILVATGATLGGHGATVHTAEDAAQALRPAAGPLSSWVFALGVLASAVLALAVLAMTTAHAVHETFPVARGNRTVGLRGHRRMVAGSLLVAGLAGLAGIPPVGILLTAGVAGGVSTPITMLLLLLVARDPDCMHGAPIGRPLAAGAAVTIALMISAGLACIGVSLAG